MFIEIDNLKIEYDYKRISDKTLIFLHGFGGNLNNFSYFANLFANFGYSTLNINLTDFGFKTTPKSFNIYDFALVIKKLINRLKIVDFAFIGHSFGGRLAIILSGLHNMGEKLVLVDSAGIRPRFNLITKIKNHATNQELTSEKSNIIEFVGTKTNSSKVTTQKNWYI